MVSLSNNTQGNVNITTRNSAGVNINSNNDTDISANMNGNSQRAKSWAVGEGLIDGVDYSAKHYAQEAKESEEIASHAIENIDTAKEQALSAIDDEKTSALNDIDTEKTEAIAEMETAKDEKIGEIEETAAGFEDDLEALTTRAETAATNAETSETNAATSATSASTSATNAAASAETATSAKNDAVSAKNAAANSASRAETYRNQANQYRDDAQNYARQASGSANTASSKAEVAKNYAQGAATASGRAEQARDAAEGYAERAEAAKDDIEAELDNYVPNTRKVNNKPLSADITLTSSDVGALANSTKYGYSIELSLDTTNYKLTLTLKDQDGTTLNTKTVDFPIESVVVNGSYDSTNKKIVLTLQSGSTIDIPVGDLISGLQTEITSTNKLDADLVDDTNSSHKFATAAQLNQIATNTSNISSINANYLTTNTAQDVSGRKTFLGEKAIYFKQSATTNKLGFTLYNPSDTELGAFEWRPSTISGGALLNINVPYSSSNYVGFRYWGTAVNVIAPKVATAGNYYIPTHITNGSTTVTATNAGVVNISTLLPDLNNYVTNSSLATTLSGYAQKSSLATVATSGSYNDLSNKPTIPAAQVQADWNVTDTTSKAYIKNKPTIPSGVVVDQTYTPTSQNAQSGVAIAGAGFLTSIPSNYLQNTATGTNSINILGQSTSTPFSVNIGYSSYANNYACALGYSAVADSNYSNAFGWNAYVEGNSAIQIGYGTNSSANSLSIGFYNNSTTHYNWKLLDGTTGLIPDARISSNIARTSQIPTVDQTFDPTSTNAQSGVAIAGELANYVKGQNGNTYIGNEGTQALLSYQNSSTGDAFGVVTGINPDFGSGVISIAVNEMQPAGYITTLTSQGLTVFDLVNQQMATLTVSNNNLAVNGSKIATQSDLSSLADTDLSNLSATGKTVIDGQWVDIDQAIISSATSLNGSTNLTYRVNLPNDGHKYEVMIRCNGYTGSTSGNEIYIAVTGNEDTMSRYACRARNANSGTYATSGTVICTMSYVASSGKNLTVSRSTNWNGSCTELRAIAYRRIGTNT